MSDFSRRVQALMDDAGATQVRRTGSGAMLWELPNGQRITTSIDNGDSRVIQNIKSDLRRKLAVGSTPPIPHSACAAFTQASYVSTGYNHSEAEVAIRAEQEPITPEPSPDSEPKLCTAWATRDGKKTPFCTHELFHPGRHSWEPEPEPVTTMEISLKLPSKSTVISGDRLKNGQMATDARLGDLLIYWKDPGGRVFTLDRTSGHTQQIPASEVKAAQVDPLPVGTTVGITSIA